MNLIVLTGGTGVFGKFLIGDLLKNNSKIVLLIRAETQEKAEGRVGNALKIYAANLKERIKILKCDLTQKNLGLSSKGYSSLIKSTTHILHAAASTRFSLSFDEARRNNVETTRKLLDFAADCSKLERFGYVSTAFVAGKRSGIILEDEFEHKKGFLNTYEQSKYEAEALVRARNNKLPLVIFRPSLIITPFQKSSTSPVSALTMGLFLARKGFLPILPGSKTNKLDVIEGTLASKALVDLFLKRTLSHKVYHIVSANNSPKIKELISLIEGQSGKKLSIRFCGNIDKFTAELKKKSRFRPDLTVIYKKMQSFLPELAFPKIFDNSNLTEELGMKTFSLHPTRELKLLLK